MTTFSTFATATYANGNIVVVQSAENMIPGLPITFAGNTFGNVTANATYYIGNIIFGYPTSNITLTSLPGGAVYSVGDGSGSMVASFSQGGQQIIPTVPPGEPLNQAFDAINLNFDQIWAAGPVGTNIQIDENTIYTLNTNGNLVLNPNGIGNVIANAHVIPDRDRVRNLGAPALRWNTIYAQNIVGNITGNIGAGGANTQVQFNDNNLLEGTAGFTFNKTTNAVTIAGTATTGNLLTAGIVSSQGGIYGDIYTTLIDSGDSSAILVVPDITLMGSLTVNQDLEVDSRISATGNITGSYFFGNGSQLTGITADNVNADDLIGNTLSGNVLYSSLITVGDLANLSVVGNTITGNLTTAGSVSATGNITGNYILGNGALLTGVITSVANINNGNSNVAISNPGGNITMGVGGTANVVVVSPTDVTITGNLTVTGNATLSGNILGDRIQNGNTQIDIQTTGGNAEVTVGGVSNVTVFATTGVYVTGVVSATGNIIGNYFFGNGSQLTGITADNVNADDLVGNTLSGNVLFSSLTSVGTLSDLDVAGNITVGNILIPSTGNVLLGNVNINDLAEPVANSDAATKFYVDSVAANVLPIITNQTIVPDGSSNTFVLTQAVPAVGLLVTINGITQTPNVNYTVAGNAITIGETPLSSDVIQVRYLSGTTTGGGGGGDYGNANVATFLAAYGSNSVSTTGNVTAGYLFGNGSQITGISISNGTSNVRIPTANSNVLITANEFYTWNFKDDGSLVLPGTTGLITSVNNASVYFSAQNNGINPIATINNIDVANGLPSSQIEVRADSIWLSTDGNNVQKDWIFDNTGNVTFPPNGQIVMDNGDATIGNQSDDFVISWDNEEIRLVSVQGSIEMQADNAFRVQTNYDGANAVYNSRWEFNQDEIVNITGDSAIVTEAGNLTLSGGRDGIASGNVAIQAVDTGVAVRTWTFGNDGNFYLPLSGNLVGTTSNNNGYLNWFGNSSGDLNGYTTMRLVPDDTVEGNDQYLILDPTAPGHIHIRAGGTQDNSAADLFLGGENSYFKVWNGANSEVSIASNSKVWLFNVDGDLDLAHDGNIVGRTSFNNGRQQWLGNSAGDGSGATTLRLIPDITLEGNEQYIIIDPTGGGDIHIRPGGNIDNSNGRLILGGENSAFVVESGPNPPVKIFSDENEWAFYGNAELAAPGAISAVGNITGSYFIGNGSQLTGLPASYSNANVATFLASYGSNSISTTGNVTAGNLIGNIQLTGNVTGTSANVTLVAGSYSWTFDNTGVATFPTVGSDEGGEINFGIPATNTTLTGPVKFDVYQNQIRFFDGSTKGLYIDVPNCATGVTTAIGYRDIPQVSLSANVTANGTVAGKHFYSTTAGNITLTIPDNANVAFPTGATLTVVVNAAGNVIVAQGTGVSLYMAGSSTTGNRTVGAYGLASVMKVATDTWVISGTGVY